jgi:hypothetical protein
MIWIRRLSQWLRSNSERYLQEAAERDTAARYGRPPPAVGTGPVDGVWRFVFVPAYRALPWRLRLTIMRGMPGSHRKQWRGG